MNYLSRPRGGLLLFCLACLIGTAQAAPASGQTLSITQAVRLALEHSASVIDARAAVEAAGIQLKLAEPWRSASLMLQGGASQQGTTAITPSFQAGLVIPPVTGLSLSATVTEAQAQLGTTWKPLARADTRAQAALEKARIAAAETERQTILLVRNSYRTAWLSGLSIEIARLNLEAKTAIAETASLNAAAGAATQTQVIAADSERINAMVAVLEAEDNASTARTELATLIGRDVTADDLEESEPGLDRRPLTLDRWIAMAASLSALGIDLSSARTSAAPVLPDLALSSRLSDTWDGRLSWSASASVSLDPDTLFREKDRLTALDLDRVVRKESETRKSVERDYASRLARLASARSGLDAARAISTTAQLSWQKSSLLAEAGTVSGASLLGARLSLLQANYQVARATANLAAALDILDEEIGK
jgi:outer membrane protein TolC